MSPAPATVETLRGVRRHAPRQLVQLMVWGAYAVLSLLQFSQYAGLQSGLIAIALLLGAGLWAASELLRAWILRRDLLRRAPAALLPRLLAAILLLAAGVQLLIFAVLQLGLSLDWLQMPGGKAEYALASSLAYWFNTAVMLGLWVALWIGIRALGQSRRDELARLRAEAAGRALELEALRARLNPHFVFNALNNVRALINEDGARARDLVTRLSSTLRHALVHSQRERVSLAEEWAVMQDYLAVEAVHFEQRLQVDAQLDPKLAGFELPPMLLQLLVENAIKHGIACTPGGGLLRVRAEAHAGGLRLTVDNPGRLHDSPQRDSTGIGLAWLRHQIGRMSPAPRFSLLQLDSQRVRAELEIPA
jgi:hypothetical protein